MKKILALTLALIMVLAMGAVAFATNADPTYSITVKNENDAMSIIGKTYTAYKLFDLKYSGDNYSYSIKTNNPFYSNTAAKAVLDEYFDFTAVASDPTTMTVTVKEAKQNTDKTLSADDVRALADALQPYATGAGAGSVTATAETATINLDEAGYYIVTGTVKPTDPENSDKEVVSAIILDNAAPAATVNPKASVPTLDKKITGVKEGESAVDGAVLDEKGKAAVAKVGSTVSYELDSVAPDLTGYSKYTFTFGDKITAGLDYVKNSFKLKVGDGEAATITPTFGEGDKSFTYTIPFATLQTYTKGAKIVLTYDCTVNDSALTTDYENNTADLTYSHSPYDDTTNKTPEKETYVIDLNLDVDKRATDASGEQLTGAKFKLYRGTTTKEYYKWDATAKKVTWVAEADADVFETEDGKLKQQVRGLDKGTYYLVETEAPTGYNLLEAPVEVVISVSETDTETENKVTYTATYGGQSATVENGEVDLTTENQAQKQPVATGTIINKSGAQLPSTGGIGTTIFYVAGSILVLAAVVLLVTKRRMNAGE